MDPNSVQINLPLAGFCKNCSVLYGKATLFFENGTQANVEHGVYEHHVVVVDLGKPKKVPFYLCQGQKGFLGSFPGSGFIVSGNDIANNMFTTPDGTFNSGYNMRNPRIAMQAELVNYRPEKQKVFIALEYEYLPTIPDPAPADAAVTLFSVTGCSPPDYHRDINQKVYNMSSVEVASPVDGYIINAKGHLHDGGDHIVLTLNGKEICNSRAIYGQERGVDESQWAVITKMEQCTSPVAIKKSDKLQITSYYDTAKYPPRPAKSHEHGGMMSAGENGEMAASADEMGVYFLNFAVTSPKV
jgi:Stress up-regulated Nod 19